VGHPPDDDDYIFASPRKQGRQPYWPDNLIKHVRQTARKAGINKHITIS